MKGCGRRIGPFECCSVVRGDSNLLLPRIPALSFDAVITDPPYGIGIAEWDKEVPYGLLTEFLRITAGPILWFGSPSTFVKDSAQFPKPPQRVLIWAPSFTLGHWSADGLDYRYHPIYAWQLSNRRGKGLWVDVFKTKTDCRHWWDHSCTKPLALMLDLCRITATGSTILDPFAGSGTTCVAAKENGQHFLGFERDEQRCITAVERLRCVGSLMAEQEAA